MLTKILPIVILFLTPFCLHEDIFAQTEEPVLYYQMEPLDDSLFIKIQEEIFIDPPDPKAEIIVDLRDANNQTVSIKGTLYPFLAFTPETRAKIQTYPFKINLAETVNYTSVFTNVAEKFTLRKIISPPTFYQISSTMGYINPFFQLFGGERFGVPIKEDIGVSFGVGTQYSGALETNFIESRLHLLGFFAGFFFHDNALTNIKERNNHNNLYATTGFEVGYVIPLGNFFQVSFLDATGDLDPESKEEYESHNTENYKVKILEGSYFNWEFRFPFSLLGSTRGKAYLARYLDEWHIGYAGREISFAGSTFDFRFDALVESDIRQPQYVFDILVQQIAEFWGFSAIAAGPSFILGTESSGGFGATSIFINVRIKVGTSL